MIEVGGPDLVPRATFTRPVKTNKDDAMCWMELGTKLRNEVERAENTVVVGAQQLQGLAENTQTRLEGSVAQAQDVLSDATALPQSARRMVEASIDRVSQRLSPGTEGIERTNKSTQANEAPTGIDALDRKNLSSRDKPEDVHAFRADSV